MKPQWIILAFAVFIASVGFMGSSVTRTYWRVPLDTLAIGHPKHTHIAIIGTVSYVRAEEDGDRHIKIRNDTTGRFIIAECIPLLPCARPDTGRVVIVRGISRSDPEHLWWEVHPVESWSYWP